jgi:hypothetical protein
MQYKCVKELWDIKSHVLLTLVLHRHDSITPHSGQMRGTCKVLVGIPEQNRPIGRAGHKWEDNIKMDLKEIRWESKNWIQLAQDRDKGWALANMVINLQRA